MLIAIPWASRQPVNSRLVNWLPRSLLKISGFEIASARPSARTQKSVSSVFESSQAST
jgi:hypothetical protein